MILPITQVTIPAKAKKKRSSAITHVVIHTAEGSYKGTQNWFHTDQDKSRTDNHMTPLGYQAVTHFLVGANGDCCQFSDTNDRLIHCGSSIEPGWNDKAVGIEHEGFTKKGGPYTKEMLEASAEITAQICFAHHVPVDRTHIIGHCEIKGVTHTDPGYQWPWNDYMTLVTLAYSKIAIRTMKAPAVP